MIPTFDDPQKLKENNNLLNKIELFVFRKVDIPKSRRRPKRELIQAEQSGFTTQSRAEILAENENGKN